MTKKQMKEKENRIKILENDINSMLLVALGFDVSDQGFIIDQDTLTKVKLGYHYLKYNPNSDITIPHHKNDIIFNPLNNKKLMSSLLELFLKKEEEDGELNIKIFYPIDDGNGKWRLELKDGVDGLYQTDNYTNQLLAYAEAILTLYDPNTNESLPLLIHELDDLKEEIK